jgi:hypothetical protein
LLTGEVHPPRAPQGRQEPELFRFTIEDAGCAGLLAKDNWRKYPAAMLRARCISAVAQFLSRLFVPVRLWTPGYPSFNQRIRTRETDLSALIEIPQNLGGSGGR